MSILIVKIFWEKEIAVIQKSYNAHKVKIKQKHHKSNNQFIFPFSKLAPPNKTQGGCED
jgi:hypothetical protein